MGSGFSKTGMGLARQVLRRRTSTRYLDWLAVAASCVDGQCGDTINARSNGKNSIQDAEPHTM